MAIRTSAIISGTVIRSSSRTIKREGKPDLTFVNVLVIGDHTMADCTLADGLTTPENGKKINARVEIDVYRDEDQLRLVEFI